MRLTTSQIRVIKDAVCAHFGRDAKVSLFGSRVNDQARGGDIDLFIQSNVASDEAAITAETALWADLQRELGEQRIDILVDYPARTARPAIFRVAREQGIAL